MNKRTILCYGELVVDCFGNVQDGFIPKFGGAPANTAIGLSKLSDATVRYAGKVGTDFFGDFMEQTLVDNGVDTTSLFRDNNHKTTLAFVSLAEDGDRSFSFFSGAHDKVTKNETDTIQIDDVSILQFGSLTQSNDVCQNATRSLLERCIQENVFISYDPNVREALWENLNLLRTTIVETLPHVNMVKINEEELEFLSSQKDVKAGAEILWNDSMQLMLVTLGAKGVYWKSRTGSGYAETIEVSAVDTTGAGDAFNAGLLSQLLPHIVSGTLNASDEEIAIAVNYAAKVASLSTTKKGATEAIPSAEEMKNYS